MLLKNCLDEFIEEKELEGVTERTVVKYETYARLFKNWCDVQEVKHIEDLNPRLMKRYFLYLKKERGNSNRTMNSVLQFMSVFFKWTLKEHILEENPCQVPKFRDDVKEIQILSEEQVRKIVRYYRRRSRLRHEYTDQRNLYMVYFLLGTGARLSEMVGLKWSQIDEAAMLIRLPVTKSRKAQVIPVSSALHERLQEWKEYQTRELGECEYLFTTKQGELLTDNGVKLVFKRLAKEMNFKNVRLSAHVFRHTFASQFIQSGGDVRSLQQILRHSSIRVTENYLRDWDKTSKDAMEAHNPLGRL